MISIANRTRGDIGILPGVIIPAGGERQITPDEYKAALETTPFQSRCGLGHLIATEVFDAFEPDPPDRPFGEPIVDPPVERLAEQISRLVEPVKSEREILTDRAAELGIKVTPRMKFKSIRKKIAEMEG